MNEQPTHLDLFSGIGGFALAAGWAGFKTIGFCDNEPYAQAVLKKHWPEVPIHKDIKELRGGAYRGCTLLTGGFPCQPFSHAGKRRGKDDDRHLWPEMLRVIEEAKPTWIIGENVAGIVNLALDQVCTDLEAEGYEVEPIIIPACAVDAPHRRDRVWIVGYAKSNGLATSKAGRGLFNQPEEQRGQEQEREFAGTSGASENVADTISLSEGSAHGSKEWGCVRGRQDEDISQRNEMGSNPSNCGQDVADTNGGQFSKCESQGQQIQMLSKSSERVCDVANAVSKGSQGTKLRSTSSQTSRASRPTPKRPCSKWATWLPEPNVGRVAHGVSNRVHRLKGLGNAIVPQVAYQIIKGIRELL